MKVDDFLLLGLMLAVLTGGAFLLLEEGTAQADVGSDAQAAVESGRKEAAALRVHTVAAHPEGRRHAEVADATLAGRVIEETEEIAVAGARVLIEPCSGTEPPLELLTDDEGAFEVGLPAGSYVVGVESGEPLSSSAMDVDLVPGATETLSFALEASFNRVVLVRDSTPGRGSVLPEPVPHADLRLVPWGRPDDAQGPSRGASLPSLSSDENGAVVLQGVPSGDYALLATANGFADQCLRVSLSYGAFLADRRTRADPIVVPMVRRGEDLVGFVLDERGRPIASALVAFVARSEGSLRDFTRRARDRGVQFAPGSPPSCRTDERGSFQIATLQGFAHRAVVVLPESESAPTVFGRVLEEPIEWPLVLQAPPSCAVDLRFEHEGSSVEGHVSISDGRLRYDWSADPLLRRIPLEAPDEFETIDGRIRVRLPLGGFKLLFSPADAAAPKKALFLQVDALVPQSATFSIP